MELKLRPIHDEEDHKSMVSLIDALIDAEPGSEDFDKLQIASDLVWSWEQTNIQIPPPDPIEAIKFRLDALGLTLRDLRPYIGSDARVSEVMAGKRDLTLKMVRALHRHLGIPLESLVSENVAGPSGVPDVHDFPIAEMAKLGWLGSLPIGKAADEEAAWKWLRDKSEAEGFEVAALCQQNSQSYANAKSDVHALYAWCLRVRAVSLSERLPKYDPKNFTLDFVKSMGQLSRFEDGPRLAQEKLNSVGVHLTIAKHLRGTFLDGAALLLPDGAPVIGMTLRHDRLDNFWHCLLHECAHVLLHLCREGSPSVFHDDFDVQGALNAFESEADDLARETLLSAAAIDSLGNLAYVSVGQVRELAKAYETGEAIIAGRIRYLTRNYSRFAKLLGYGEPSRILGPPA